MVWWRLQESITRAHSAVERKVHQTHCSDLSEQDKGEQGCALM